MLKALGTLDVRVPEPLQLLIGGGAAFVLGHQITLATQDIDAVPYKSKLSAADLDPHVKAVAQTLKIPSDWLNPYYGTFTYSLPKDYGNRLVTVFEGKKIRAVALGKEDLLIMKCFAGREKDMPHAGQLLKKGVNIPLVREHLHQCLREKLPRAQEACDFFYDLCEQLGIDA